MGDSVGHPWYNTQRDEHLNEQNQRISAYLETAIKGLNKNKVSFAQRRRNKLNF